jgi:hypothetical protein
MSDKIKRVTPREIADMLINEEAYQSTLFVTAEDHDAEIERLRARVEVLERVVFLRTRYAGPTGAEVRMAQEIERLRAALRFYAEPYKYTDIHGDDVQVPDFYSETDFGETARLTLEGKL